MDWDISELTVQNVGVMGKKALILALNVMVEDVMRMATNVIHVPEMVSSMSAVIDAMVMAELIKFAVIVDERSVLSVLF